HRPWPLIRRSAPPSPRLRGEGKKHVLSWWGGGEKHVPRSWGKRKKLALLFPFPPLAGSSFFPFSPHAGDSLFPFSPHAGDSLFPFSPRAGRRCRRRMRGAFRVARASIDYLATGNAAREGLPPRTSQRPWPLIRRYAPPSPRLRGEGKRHATRLRGEGEKRALLLPLPALAGVSLFPFSPLAGRRCRRRMRGAFRVALASVDYLATGNAARERLPPRTSQGPWPLIRRYAPPSPRSRGEGKRHAPRSRGEGKKYVPRL